MPDGTVIFTLADNEDDSLGFMTADDTSFYFTASGRRVGGAELDRVSKAGGTATKIADVGASTPSIDFETNGAYFVQGTSIVSVPLSGGAATTLVPNTTAPAVFATRGFVYWVDPQTNGGQAAVVSFMPTTGGSIETLNLPAGMSAQHGAYAFAADAHALFVSVDLAGVARVPFDGSPSTVLTTALATTMVVDATTLYFVTSSSDSQTLLSIPKEGGSSTTLTSGSIAGLAVDGRFVYFTTLGPTGRVMKIPSSGGDAIVVADRQPAPFSIVIDDKSVYWDCADDGTIRTSPK
ncbi:MAG TPA: DUF5050 domain-containing protein [Polyangiaceae bacterium]